MKIRTAFCLAAGVLLPPGLALSEMFPPTAVASRGAWTVEIIPNSTGGMAGLSSGGRRPVRIESASDGFRKRDIVVFADGSKEEFWFFNGLVFSLNADGKTVSVSNFNNARTGENESGASPRYPGLWWLSSAKPVESIRREDRELLHFIRESVPVGTPFLHAVTEAWVDAKTGQPVEAITPFATYRFTYQSMPAGELRMPPVFREAAEQALRRESRRAVLAEAFKQP